jgi:hypothetical protein
LPEVVLTRPSRAYWRDPDPGLEQPGTIWEEQIAKKQVNKPAPGIADEEITQRAPGLTVGNSDKVDARRRSALPRAIGSVEVEDAGLNVSAHL